jgi:hypothetical protein
MMDESCLHNMSAPPRSKIIVAPNKKALPQLRFRLHEFPPKGKNYAHRLAEMFHFNNIQALLDFDASLRKKLSITPIMSTIKFNDNTIQVNTPLINLFVLSRTSGTLFMLRRTPEYTYARMSRKIFLPLHGFSQHFDGEELCLP